MKQIKHIIAQREAISWLARLQSDNILESEKAEFFIWLEKSNINQAAYIQAESLWEKGEALTRPNDEELRGQILTWFRPQTIFYSGVSLACALFLFVTFLPTSSSEILYTEQQQQKIITLDDGSQLTLNPNSRISVTLSRRHRHVLLHRGQVFFDVATDPSRPFEVETDLGLIRVLGTEFSVEKTTNPHTETSAEPSDVDVIVTVVEGKVGIIPLEKNFKSQKEKSDYTLVKDEQISLNEAAAGSQVKTIDAKRETAWTKGQIIYKGETLGKVIQDLEFYNNVIIKVTDDRLKHEKLHATLSINKVHASLLNIAHALNIELEFTNKKEHDAKSDTKAIYTLGPM
ncbi:MAG: FecR domain-containing protein [Agarilytica sp.]